MLINVIILDIAHYMAAQNGHLSTIKLLIKNGADINLYYNDGFSPLYCAIMKNHFDIIKLLLDNNDIIISKKEIKLINTKKEKFIEYEENNAICHNCSNEKTAICSRCKFVGYCSEACQIEHWKYHKKLCKKTFLELQGFNIIFYCILSNISFCILSISSLFASNNTLNPNSEFFKISEILFQYICGNVFRVSLICSP